MAACDHIDPPDSDIRGAAFIANRDPIAACYQQIIAPAAKSGAGSGARQRYATRFRQASGKEVTERLLQKNIFADIVSNLQEAFLQEITFGNHAVIYAFKPSAEAKRIEIDNTLDHCLRDMAQNSLLRFKAVINSAPVASAQDFTVLVEGNNVKVTVSPVYGKIKHLSHAPFSFTLFSVYQYDV